MNENNNKGCKMVGMLDIKGQDQCRRVYSVDGIAPTLTTSQGGQREVKIFDTKRLRVRKLTPKEYGILQAFPMDEWEQVVSDSQAYKQFGNAVTTTLFQAIAENIAKSIMEAENGKELKMSEEIMNTPTEETSQEIKKAIDAAELAKEITYRIMSNENISSLIATEIEEVLNKNFAGLEIKTSEDKRDWEAAGKALAAAGEMALQMPGGQKYYEAVFASITNRFKNGERTPELFNEIVELTRG